MAIVLAVKFVKFLILIFGFTSDLISDLSHHPCQSLINFKKLLKMLIVTNIRDCHFCNVRIRVLQINCSFRLLFTRLSARVYISM